MSGIPNSRRRKEMLRRAAGDRRVWIAGLSVLLVVVWAGPDVARWVWHVGDDGRIERHMPLIREHAEAAGLDVELVRTVVMAESSGRARAKSDRGARGLMQITAITEQDVLQRRPEIKQGDLFDPDYNLRVGTTYLAYLLERFDGDEMLALMAYHMGPTRVRRVQREQPGITPDQILEQHAGPQTRAYVRRVLRGR